MKAIFQSTCPNCGKDISDERLFLGIPCESCFPKKIRKEEDIHEFQVKIGEYLKESNKLWNYKYVYELAKKFLEFKKIFIKAIKKKPWSAQSEWIKRVLKGKSFSIIAPTGMGKTVFGIISSIYLAWKNKRAYIIVPTRVLVEDVYQKACKFSEECNLRIKILRLHSKMKKKERTKVLEELKDFSTGILITTSKFLSSNFSMLEKIKFDFIFVDDVDAVLKTSKNIEKILFLLGFSSKDVKKAYQLIDLKANLANVKDEKNMKKILKKIEILEKKLPKLSSLLIVSSATAKPKGKRVKLFRELLGFEIGSSTAIFRNVKDLYLLRKDVKKQIFDLIKKLGKGGIVFVSLEDGETFAHEILEYLKKSGIKAEGYFGKNVKLETLEKFKTEELDVLIGMESYYGMLVRGLDLPEVVRYAIHTRVPKFVFDLKIEEASPYKLYFLLAELQDFFPEKYKKEATSLLKKFKKIISLPRNKLEYLTQLLKEKSKDERFSFEISTCEKTQKILKSVLLNEKFQENIKSNPYISIRISEEGTRILIPDVRTYIQASGRTSRMFPGGVTKGISIVLVDDEKTFRGLERRLRWYFEDIRFEKFEDVELEKLIEEVNRDRELVKLAIEGRIEIKWKDPVKSALLIVESPHKAQTISKFFGKPSRRRINGIISYEVTTGDYLLNIVATKGHVMDLVEDKGFHGVLIKNGFIPVYGSIKKCKKCNTQFISPKICPKCKSSEVDDARIRLENLRDIAFEVDYVFLGTDPDREGEKIAWDVAAILTPYSKEIKRLEFHEVTRSAILKALQNLREINENMVNAQIVRRVEDRWLGFQLSQKLWKVLKNKKLSAGRVQTPVLGWIIKRFDEYKTSWRLVLSLILENGFKLEIKEVKNPKEVKRELKKKLVNVSVIGETEKEVRPPPPFSTDDLLSETSKILKFSAIKTMKLAQTLFEAGFITYHRTDSKYVSNEGVRIAEEYIKDRFGITDFKPRKWPKKGAHECIRPTKPIDVFELSKLIRETGIKELSKDHLKLYNLIFKRFISSQMSNAKVVYQKVKFKIASTEIETEIPVEIKKDGFLKILPMKIYPRVLPPSSRIRKYFLKNLPTVLPFTQGEIIREMKKRNIGRPSTYAIIIQKILERKYAIESKGRIIPTPLGRKVFSYLSKNYPNIVSEEVTRILEEKIDKVEKGYDYREILKNEYEIVKKI